MRIAIDLSADSSTDSSALALLCRAEAEALAKVEVSTKAEIAHLTISDLRFQISKEN